MGIRISKALALKMGCDLPNSKVGPKQPNRWEARYRDEVLIPRVGAHEIRGYGFEVIKLKIGHDCWFTPDWAVFLPGGQMELHEVKGFRRDDAMVKLRAVASIFPFRVVLVWLDGGVWQEKEIL